MGLCHHISPNPSPGAAALPMRDGGKLSWGGGRCPVLALEQSSAAADYSWEELWACPEHGERKEAG